ncbi:tetratricopeptide repeat family protein, partial [Vibrio parahaemolyticus V-223/04]
RWKWNIVSSRKFPLPYSLPFWLCFCSLCAAA